MASWTSSERPSTLRNWPSWVCSTRDEPLLVADEDEDEDGDEDDGAWGDGKVGRFVHHGQR